MQRSIFEQNKETCQISPSQPYGAMLPMETEAKPQVYISMAQVYSLANLSIVAIEQVEKKETLDRKQIYKIHCTME